MGGTISVDSTEGGGSSFAIALPLARHIAAEFLSEAEAPRV
jgi:signal transduction histidine kinase